MIILWIIVCVCGGGGGGGMRELALFAGAGGGLIATKRMGWRTVCAVEANPYCREVLASRQADGLLDPFPIWDDVCTFDGRPWRGIANIISAGFPCQDISIAGDGDGIEGEQSGLWRQVYRIAGDVGPDQLWLENSPMLTVRGLGRVLGDLARLGYNAEWGVLGGFTAGGCSDGKRIWILATKTYRKRFPTPQILFEKSTAFASSKWQFERAIGAAMDERDYARMCGDSDVMARGMDRLKAVGNGQNPILAELAWRTLTR